MTVLVPNRPAPGIPRPFRFPEFSRTTLDGGLTLITCDIPGRPLISAHLTMEAGAAQEVPERGGVAALAAAALTEGTESKDATAFAEAVERLGAEIDARSGWETIVASARVPASRIGPVLELLAATVRLPRFPENEIERLKQERLNEIRQAYANPMRRAMIAFMGAAYTGESLYGRPQGGTFETVGPLGKSEVAAHYATYATPGSATLVVAGDLAGTGINDLAAQLFADWRAPEAARRSAVAEGTAAPTSVLVIDRPGAVQSNIVLGHVGIARNAPDYNAVELMAHALGGSFNSRMNMRLREEKGYTYGSSAMFDPRRGTGPFLALAPVERSVTTDAVADMLGVIRSVAAEGLRQEELDAARDYQSGIFALRFETPEAIASGIDEILTYRLADDYFDTYGRTLQSLTLDDLDAAARAHLDPDHTSIVVVGDAEAVVPELERAAFGPVTVTKDELPE
ncbi:MAG: pitrilysin family protein [Actinomycetota bacterium]